MNNAQRDIDRTVLVLDVTLEMLRCMESLSNWRLWIALTFLGKRFSKSLLKLKEL